MGLCIRILIASLMVMAWPLHKKNKELKLPLYLSYRILPEIVELLPSGMGALCLGQVCHLPDLTTFLSRAIPPSALANRSDSQERDQALGSRVHL